jgi:hypothetical protein
LGITTVTFDLDDLKAEADNFDDPVLTVEVDLSNAGQAMIIPNGCGTWEVTYDSGEAMSHNLTGQQLVSLITAECEGGFIEDAGHCEALLAGAAEVNVVEISVDAEDVNQAMVAALGRQLDSDFCLVQ